MTTKYIVIYTDFGDTCDGLARVSGVFNTQADAVDEMKKDVEYYLDQNPDLTVTDQQVPNWFLVGDEDNGCQWQILEVEV